MDYIIVGTDHRLQKSDTPDTGLRDLLQSIVDTHPVVLIAEEVKTSEDVHTFGRELIGDSKWLSIDMTIQQRKDARLDDIPCEEGPGGYDPIKRREIIFNRHHTAKENVRETFWLDRIAQWCADHKLSVGTVILICGHNHMRAGFLSDKVLQRGHTVSSREYMSTCDIETELGVFTICP